ncbi:hypothetical protein CDA63_12275 [Hymenobacter amundsenii]|uniref:DUF4142 domain-containing protein n=1 Tax=Hymenobacter amundsenii TaxID=2006685 RepID=A0A246FJU3_9BACT|nr:DUF4142 domain-containing protein [Hymenobacter amundsenii]OWP62822.1 hypothetical protein CDA63_12275 [Hymenobacter amundsenii]
MNKSLNRLFTVFAISSLSLWGTTKAQAQRRSVKEANKINEKRNDVKSDMSGINDSKLDYDSEFVVAAASSNMLEIALGQLAQQKGLVTEVKEWGKKMEQDHGMAEQQLREIAFRDQITLPGMMSKDGRDMYDDVDDRKYLGFDKKYLRTLKDLHEQDLKRYAEAATKLRNPDLQRYATQMLLQLREHETMVDQLYQRANDRK